MRLAAYVEAQGHGAVKDLAAKAGVSRPTIFKAIQGEPIGRWDVARRISEATGGQVSIRELCEPTAESEPPPPENGEAA